MKYQQLTEGQRYQIALLYGERFSCRDIGLRVGVNKSTVSRELRRNCTPDGYAPNEAQRLSEQRRHGATKYSICQNTIDFVELTLRWQWSPEQISAVAIERPDRHNSFVIQPHFLGAFSCLKPGNSTSSLGSRDQ